jgi:hypothetical protein
VISLAAFAALVLASGAPAAAPPSLIRTINRPPDFTDYPATVYRGPLRFPREVEWPDANWKVDAAGKINFAGHFTHVTISCGIACTSDWIVDRENGRMIRVPAGPAGIEVASIDTRADSNLMKISWVSSRNDGSGDTVPPCFIQFYIWTGYTLSPLANRVEGKCPQSVTN